MGGRRKVYRHPRDPAFVFAESPGYPSGVDHLVWNSRPALRHPVLVCAFRGWNDGGQAATLAATFLRETPRRRALLRPRSRGVLRLPGDAARPSGSRTGSIRRIDWPENSVTHAALPGLERDVAILLGIEPQLRWRTFSQTVLELVRALKVEFVITLGGLLADTPHTRPVPVTGTAEGEVADEARPQPLELRGPDRHRRRAARRVPRGGRFRPRACGRRSPTTSRSRRTRRPRLP